MASRNILEVAVREGSSLANIDTILDSSLKKDFVSITVATKMLGIAHAQYVRRLVVGSKLDSYKVQLEHYSKWFVSKASIKDYLANNRRTSTDRRYILRTNIENEKKVRAALDASGVQYSLELNYQGGSKK